MDKKLIVIAEIAKVAYLLSVLNTEVEKETTDTGTIMTKFVNTRTNFESLQNAVRDLTAGV
jgi:hypothetical protein